MRKVWAVGTIVAVVTMAVLWWVSPPTRVRGTVVAVTDGDTIEVEIGDQSRVVRLLGIDTPETKHPTKGVQCFGPEASAFTTTALLGRQVELEYDVERRDMYDRDLAWVYVDGERFNDVLVSEGFAHVLLIAPNGAHGRAVVRAQLDARSHGRGLWSEC